MANNFLEPHQKSRLETGQKFEAQPLPLSFEVALNGNGLGSDFFIWLPSIFLIVSGSMALQTALQKLTAVPLKIVVGRLLPFAFRKNGPFPGDIC